MTPSKRFIKTVLEAVATELQRSDWVRRKHGYSTHLSDDIYGFIGLNRAVGHGDRILELNPIVGVGSLKLEKVYAELTGRHFQPYSSAAIARNVGYLMPGKQYKPWLFQEGFAYDNLLSNMLSAIEDFGRPFMKRYMNLSDLCEAMKHSKLGGPYDDYRIPVACALLGKAGEADAFLEAKLQEREARQDAEAKQFRMFAKKLRDMGKLTQ
jgi:hypothetical protein